MQPQTMNAPTLPRKSKVAFAALWCSPSTNTTRNDYKAFCASSLAQQVRQLGDIGRNSRRASSLVSSLAADLPDGRDDVRHPAGKSSKQKGTEDRSLGSLNLCPLSFRLPCSRAHSAAHSYPRRRGRRSIHIGARIQSAKADCRPHSERRQRHIERAPTRGELDPANLQVINRDVHAAKCASEARHRRVARSLETEPN
jgi:hypothetical protein